MINNKKTLAIGLMSGTSADGLSVCLFDVKAKKVIRYKDYPYAKALRQRILAAPDMQTPQLAALNFELGKLYAEKVKLFIKEFKIDTKKVAAIGSHGQTVYHNPQHKIPNTLQIGEASFLALETGLPVVCDFRPMDMAAGGTGAPLIPYFDNFLFGQMPPLVLLNIGGISNAAAVGKGIKTFGFDIGPGNVMIDAAITLFSNGNQLYDKDGALAAAFEPDTQKAKSMLNLFIGARPPVSLERSAYAQDFIRKHFPKTGCADIATITYLTALVIAESLKKFIFKKHKISTVALNGGGAYNKTLVSFLQGLLSEAKIINVDELGVPSMAKEAAAFALFAYNTINGRTSNCKEATGAGREVVLGKIIKV